MCYYVMFVIIMLVVCVLLFQDINNTLKSLDMRLATLFERQKHLERRDNELRQQKKELLERGNKRKQLESKIAMKCER